MRRMSYALSLLIAVVVAFTACSKEGSEGPPGPAGPAGPQGPSGAQGPRGDTGVANVIYSDWLDVEFSLLDDTSAFVGVIEATQLTKEILSTGEIKVYVNLNTVADPVISALPFIGNDGLLINAIFAEQTIAMSSNGDVSTFTDEGEKVLQYRYLIIPGGTPSLKKAQIDLNDYNKVKAFYGLKD